MINLFFWGYIASLAGLATFHTEERNEPSTLIHSLLPPSSKGGRRLGWNVLEVKDERM
jgi:hypothetical protein